MAVTGELTAAPELPPAPAPAVPYGPGCTEQAGCYANRQLEAMLTTALNALGKASDQLAAIRKLMAEALNPPPKEAP